MPGRLSDSQIAEKHPSGVDRRACRANPLGHPAGAHAGRTAGRTFCDPRTSCGDTNGSTLHVAKQVRGIQNPQGCRQAHRISHLSGAPLLSTADPITDDPKSVWRNVLPVTRWYDVHRRMITGKPPMQDTEKKPIFWSFRRCPYAMRARLAVCSAGIRVELREILLLSLIHI